MINFFQFKKNNHYMFLSDNKVAAEEYVEYYSIGDVHGCFNEYTDLIALIDEDAKNRNSIACIIQHGDLIDRGPSLKGVLQMPVNINLIGNHELNFVHEYFGVKECRSNSRKINHVLFSGYDEKTKKDLIKRINESFNFVSLDIDGREFILSHAPPKNIENFQSINDWESSTNAQFFCMRSKKPDQELMDKLDKEVTFVYGHQSWEYKEIEEQKVEQRDKRAQHYNIDASCVYGGELVALRLRDLGVLRVKSNVKHPKD